MTGIASRSQYAWAGVSYQRYAESARDRRPDVLFYSAVYGYRPLAWRTDTGWDWRIFGEFTGEQTGAIQMEDLSLPGRRGNQMFLGPTTLGVYKNYAVSAGVQFPVYQNINNASRRTRISGVFSAIFERAGWTTSRILRAKPKQSLSTTA